MKLCSKNQKRFFSHFAVLFVLSSFALNAQTLLSADFSDFFPKEIFKEFPPFIQVFKNKAKTLDLGLFDFDKTYENDEIIEIKYVYYQSNLPKISETGENEYEYAEDFSMRYFHAQNSIIAFHVDPAGFTTKVFNDGVYIRQQKFDQNERLFHEIVWKIDSDNYYTQTLFTYLTNENTIPDYSVEKNYETKQIKVCFYEDNSLVGKELTYQFECLDENYNDDLYQCEFPSENLVCTQEFKYDSENHVVYECRTQGENTYSVQRKYTSFVYPDETISENGVVKSKKHYSSNTNYVTQVFLTDGFSVRSVYVDNQLQKTAFYKDGVFLRENVVDNQ